MVLSPQNLWLGNININTFGMGLVSPSYRTFIIDNVNLGFIKPQLRTHRMLYNYKMSSTQGASVVRRNLDIASFLSIKLKRPSAKSEENKISQVLKSFDNQIKDTTRVVHNLKEIRKSLLQKMFV